MGSEARLTREKRGLGRERGLQGLGDQAQPREEGAGDCRGWGGDEEGSRELCGGVWVRDLGARLTRESRGWAGMGGGGSRVWGQAHPRGGGGWVG